MRELKTRKEAEDAARELDGRAELAEDAEARGVRVHPGRRPFARVAQQHREEAARIRALLPTLPEDDNGA